MLKIIYFIKSEKSNAKDECPIYAKISYQGKSITMSTGKYITKDRWNFTSNLRGPLKIQKEKVIKASLDALSMLFETKFNLLLKNNSTVGFPKNRTVNNSNLLTLNSNCHNEKQQI